MAQQHHWVVGFHAVEELLRRNPQDVLELLVQRGREDQRLTALRALADEVGIHCVIVDKADLEARLAGPGRKGPVHQGVAAWCRLGNIARDEAFLTKLLDDAALSASADADKKPPLLLVLDEITDPHNFGACLRSADAAGVDAVIVPKDRSAPLNMTVRKVACGAAESVPVVVVTNLSRTLGELAQRGIWIAGAAGEATQSVYELDMTGPLALVMGSEGKGLRRLTREHCDYLINIPMAGAVSSLNVSVATGICLFEAVRQRQQ